MAATFRLLLPLALVTVAALAGWRQKSDRHDHTATQGPGWAALTGSMDTMHAAMSSVRQSGDSDADFVTLMLPHHRGAIEMAKAELMYGKDERSLSARTDAMQVDVRERAMAVEANKGIIDRPSLHTVDQTVATLEAILRSKGITVFAVVDHSGEAKKVGMTMRPTKLVIFGNPKAGKFAVA